MHNNAVAYYHTSPAGVLKRVGMNERKQSLEAFAEARGLRLVRSFSGPVGGDEFQQALTLARSLPGLLLVTHDSTDEQDVRLMLNLSRTGVNFFAVNVWKTPRAGDLPH